jgi:hypothetical protein
VLHLKLKVLTMMSDDSYSDSETESERSFSALDFDSTVQEAEARRVLPRELVRKKAKSTPKVMAVYSKDLRALILMDKYITKCLYGQDYDYNTSLRVVGAALHMQKGYLQRVAKLGKGRGREVPRPQICDTFCDLFHMGHDAYSQIVGGYLADHKVYQSGKDGAGRAGNSKARDTRIPRTQGLQIQVRDFVRCRIPLLGSVSQRMETQSCWPQLYAFDLAPAGSA